MFCILEKVRLVLTFYLVPISYLGRKTVYLLLNTQIEVSDCQVGEPQKRKKGIFGIKGGDKEVMTVVTDFLFSCFSLTSWFSCFWFRLKRILNVKTYIWIWDIQLTTNLRANSIFYFDMIYLVFLVWVINFIICIQTNHNLLCQLQAVYTVHIFIPWEMVQKNW